MATLENEPRIVNGLIKLDIEELHTDMNQMLTTAMTAADALTAIVDDPTSHDANLPQTINAAAIEKVEKVEKLLEDQVLTKRKAA
jgi:hypothetical protein